MGVEGLRAGTGGLKGEKGRRGDRCIGRGYRPRWWAEGRGCSSWRGRSGRLYMTTHVPR